MTFNLRRGVVVRILVLLFTLAALALPVQAQTTGNFTRAFPEAGAWVKRSGPTTGAVRNWDGRFLTRNHYSDDGTNWATLSEPTDVQAWINRIGYGNGTFVLTGAAKDLWTSTDGANWTKRATPGGYDDLTDIAYGNGRFVVRRYWDLGALLVSQDNGVTWTYVATGSAPDRNYNSLSFGKGRFLHPLDNRVQVSVDGLNWIESTVGNLPAGFEMRYAAGHDGERFIGVMETARAAGTVQITTAYSTNGSDWTFNTSGIATTVAHRFHSEIEGACPGLLTLTSEGATPPEVWFSRDQGLTWNQAAGPWTVAGNYTASFAGNAQRLVVATDNGIYSAESLLTPTITGPEPDTDGDGLSDDYEKGIGRVRAVNADEMGRPYPFSWDTAKAHAESLGGHLATITSQAEWDSYTRLISIPSEGRFYLGGTDRDVEGEFKWITGEPWSSAWQYPIANPDSNADYLYIHRVWDYNNFRFFLTLIIFIELSEINPHPFDQGYILEIGHYTDPLNPDTDGDGYLDGLEVAQGFSPVDPASHPVLVIPPTPRPAQATAQVVNGFVVGATLTNGGWGYTNTPVVRIVGGGGSGAHAEAVVSNGVVVAIIIRDAGFSYASTVRVVIQPPFIAPPQLGIAPYTLLSFTNLAVGGTYELQSFKGWYWTNEAAGFAASSPTYTQRVRGAPGTKAYRLALSPAPSQAFATPALVFNFLVAANVTAGGSGYVTPPEVRIVGGGGTGAVAVATMSGGSVVGITILDAGIGYTNTPTLRIDPPPAAAAIPQDIPVMRVDAAALSPFDTYQWEFKPTVAQAWQPWGELFAPSEGTNTQFLSITNDTSLFRLKYVP